MLFRVQRRRRVPLRKNTRAKPTAPSTINVFWDLVDKLTNKLVSRVDRETLMEYIKYYDDGWYFNHDDGVSSPIVLGPVSKKLGLDNNLSRVYDILTRVPTGDLYPGGKGIFPSKNVMEVIRVRMEDYGIEPPRTLREPYSPVTAQLFIEGTKPISLDELIARHRRTGRPLNMILMLNQGNDHEYLVRLIPFEGTPSIVYDKPNIIIDNEEGGVTTQLLGDEIVENKPGYVKAQYKGKPQYMLYVSTSTENVERIHKQLTG